MPLDGEAGFDEVSGFAHSVGAILVERDPEHLTQEFIKADRGGRILVDTGRNGYSATFAAAYAVRAQAGRARVGAVHVGGDRARRGRSADVHAADDGRPRRPRGRSVVGHARAVAAKRKGAAIEALELELTGPGPGAVFQRLWFSWVTAW